MTGGQSLRAAAVLYNTYWVRYDYRREIQDFGHELAVSNTQVLFDCARRAEVGRIVHVANASASPDGGCFSGQHQSGMIRALVLRPSPDSLGHARGGVHHWVPVQR
jgi:hypothetical protein